MTNENVKTKNEGMQMHVGLNRFFFCCPFGSFLNFDLYFYFLIFNFYIITYGKENKSYMLSALVPLWHKYL